MSAGGTSALSKLPGSHFLWLITWGPSSSSILQLNTELSYRPQKDLWGVWLAHYKEFLISVGGIVVDTGIAEQEKGSRQCIAPGMGQFWRYRVVSSIQGAVRGALKSKCLGLIPIYCDIVVNDSNVQSRLTTSDLVSPRISWKFYQERRFPGPA